MAKEFYTSGIGSAQTLNPSDESKIKIYDDKAAADLDLANIEENEIIATKAGESEGVVEVVDTVEENNPYAVSSGAVFGYALPLLGNFTSLSAVVLPTSGGERTITEGWYCVRAGSSAGAITIVKSVANTDTPVATAETSSGIKGCYVYLRAGVYKINYSGTVYMWKLEE